MTEITYADLVAAAAHSLPDVTEATVEECNAALRALIKMICEMTGVEFAPRSVQVIGSAILDHALNDMLVSILESEEP